jgi:citrate synthase
VTGTSRRLTSQAVAERLGVDRSTVYAYVSRGLLHSRREGRGSTFDPDEVDRLRTQGQLARRPTSSTAVVHTGLTSVGEDWLAYRGVDVEQFLTPPHFEAAVTWLWEAVWDPTEQLAGDPAALRAAGRAVAALPRAAGVHARALAAVVAAAAERGPAGGGDRHDTALALGPTLIRAVAVSAAPSGGLLDADRAASEPVAALLGRALTGGDPTPDLVLAGTAALVLLADHDLAASTLAARVAASTGATPDLVVAAGLSALAGPLHGGSGPAALRLLDAGSVDPDAALAHALAGGDRVAGFGHVVYRQDPRARLLLEVLDASAEDDRPLHGFRRLAGAAGRHGLPGANVDLALAALTRAFALPDRTPAVLHAVARTAGWIAHLLEEADERGLRFRPRSVYDGPARGRRLPR